MFIIDGVIKAVDYLKSNFKLGCRKSITKDEDDNGNEYTKTIWYMEDKTLFDISMIDIIHKERSYVVDVLKYICQNLTWGTNVIILDNKRIAEYTGVNKPDISRAITRLVSLNIIVKAKTLDIYKNDNDISNKLYIVNHNMVFRGNSRKLKKDFDKQ